MRIFHSHESVPMLLDTAEELNVLYQKMCEFMASELKEASFSAEVNLSPEPYAEFLNGLRIQKAQGAIMLRLSQDRWLELSGSEYNLEKYISHFQFQESEQDTHHHPDNADYMANGSLGLIIEADSTWAEHNAA